MERVRERSGNTGAPTSLEFHGTEVSVAEQAVTPTSLKDIFTPIWSGPLLGETRQIIREVTVIWTRPQSIHKPANGESLPFALKLIALIGDLALVQTHPPRKVH